jgi:hypothetical protein
MRMCMALKVALREQPLGSDLSDFKAQVVGVCRDVCSLTNCLFVSAGLET